MKTKFYVCPVCGNVMVKLVDSGVTPTCCGQPMQILEPKLSEPMLDMSEKHIPKVRLLDDSTIRVEVGSKLHPMSPEHGILFILLETEHGTQIRHLSPSDKPTATFCCERDKPVAAYAYCNIHGLWANQHMPPTIQRLHRCFFGLR